MTSPLLSLVDTSVVGLTSESQLAAMAPATALSDGLSYTLTFIPIGVTNLVSLHMSRGHPRRAGVHPLKQKTLSKTKNKRQKTKTKRQVYVPAAINLCVIGLSSESLLAAMAPAIALSDGLACTLAFISIGRTTNLAVVRRV
jgi:hypothetical protein